MRAEVHPFRASLSGQQIRAAESLKHADHIKLLQGAELAAGGIWADLGAGSGAFTLALRELVGPSATIHAVDKNKESLKALRAAYDRLFGEAATLRIQHADFSGPLGLPPLDGALMANSLHYFKDKAMILGRVREMLRPGGLLLIVEYDVDRGNAWVPFPISFGKLGQALSGAGFGEPQLLGRRPSSFLGAFYSAAAVKEA